MVEVTEDDKEIAAELAHALGMTAEEFTSGACDVLVQIAARHRQAGVQQGLDMAKAVVERRKQAAEKAFDHAVEVRHHEHQTRFACQHREAEECAADLSKLGGGDA